ncbi:hypothetical protein [Cohnella panacarvi]|uniref:hypothetical protein n=1 Tax=Cohnella panacarvi TaxID=400776 RepID=UPI00047DE218|nr:hypothetical protein [Cohnella panacarvi]
MLKRFLFTLSLIVSLIVASVPAYASPQALITYKENIRVTASFEFSNMYNNNLVTPVVKVETYKPVTKIVVSPEINEIVDNNYENDKFLEYSHNTSKPLSAGSVWKWSSKKSYSSDKTYSLWAIVTVYYTDGSRFQKQVDTTWYPRHSPPARAKASTVAIHYNPNNMANIQAEANFKLDWDFPEWTRNELLSCEVTFTFIYFEGGAVIYAEPPQTIAAKNLKHDLISWKSKPHPANKKYKLIVDVHQLTRGLDDHTPFEDYQKSFQTEWNPVISRSVGSIPLRNIP